MGVLELVNRLILIDPASKNSKDSLDWVLQATYSPFTNYRGHPSTGPGAQWTQVVWGFGIKGDLTNGCPHNDSDHKRVVAIFQLKTVLWHSNLCCWFCSCWNSYDINICWYAGSMVEKTRRIHPPSWPRLHVSNVLPSRWWKIWVWLWGSWGVIPSNSYKVFDVPFVRICGVDL